ncbi:(2Fe-2S)-binding protein [Streptomyces sp. AC512_CC834]|uniref:(2Fe-2S)-binding protein n=1 Tax=Streptomyces sp. AC512_CC834 TaxID=2823691 RepID=UPI001C26E7EA|nr:(2Fe-2S)-binding protein [Streptomyces sp. AC512_CC834]
MSAPGPALTRRGTTPAERGLERGPDPVRITLSINGTEHSLDIEPRVSLLDALREHLDLTGAKKGCDQGTCGACTVWVDGRRALACLTLALTCEGHEVTTIEGLSPGEGPGAGPGEGQGEGPGEELHPVQRAFVEQDAFQCGYCTPGQIMSAVALIEEGHAEDDAEIKEWMSGNICRCAAYPNIRAAIRAVRDQS